MSRAKARELSANARAAQPYVKPDMTGRVSHSDLWERARRRWRPGIRVWVEFHAG